MSIVKYYTRDEQKTFDCQKAIKDGWGINWGVELKGLQLQDRKQPEHIVEIEKTSWMLGIFIIHFKEGGWQCFDHCIEQFKIVAK